MAIWPFGRREKNQDEVISRVVPMYGDSAQPIKPSEDLLTLGTDGYRKNTVIKACVQEIATSAAEPRLVVEKRKAGQFVEVDETHPLRTLMERPNRAQSRFEFLEQLFTDLETFGNAYVHKVRAKSSGVVELFNLRPYRVSLVVDSTGVVARYVFKRSPMQSVQIDAADIIHFKYVDPTSDFLGLPPAVSALEAADMDDRAIAYLRAFFINGGVPQGFLKLKARVERKERERIRQGWTDTYGGERGWHMVGVLDADADYEETGSRPDKLNLDKIFDVTESRICAAFQVPPIIIAIRIGLMRSTFANYGEARTSFWRETLSPKYERVGDKLTHGLAVPDFGTDLRVRFGLEDIAAFQESAISRRQWAREGWNDGLLTRNEARVYAGGGSIGPDGDVFKRKTNDGEPEIAPKVIAIPLLKAGEVPSEASSTSDSGVTPDLESTVLPSEMLTVTDDQKRVKFVKHSPKSKEWQAMHKVADRWVEPFVRAFTRNRNLGVTPAIEAKIAMAIGNGDFAAIEEAIGWEGIAAKMEQDFAITVQAAADGAADASKAFLPKAVRVNLVFDLKNPLVQQFAATRSSDLVREISKGTLDNLRRIMNDVFDQSIAPKQAAKRIQTHVGLTEKQGISVERFRDRQIAKLGDVPTKTQLEAAEKRTARYAQKTLRRRALNIARTETIRSASEGQRMLWREATSQGLFDEPMERLWIVTPDDALDLEVCAPMADQRRGVDEMFETGTGGQIMSPPAHPQCRCATGLIEKEEE